MEERDEDMEGYKTEDSESPLETTKRRERRHCQLEHSSKRRRQLREGKKANFLEVDEVGVPYGLGVGEWHAELNKLRVALDQSSCGIARQGNDLLTTFYHRLGEN